MTFVREARGAAVRWKRATPALSDEAKLDASYRGSKVTYPFCIPADYASYNLLPEARAHGIARFAALGIPWHHGIDGGPSNHLLSSQVQCVNALAPLVRNAPALQAIFGAELDVAEVLPFGGAADDADDFVVFEWIGANDYLGERVGKSRTRGANTTSADAAIRYRTGTGAVEVALIEWKYTEQYAGHELSSRPTSMPERHARYRALFEAADGPVRGDLVEYEDLFVEPFYQLFRLQLLADQMERAHEQDAAHVRLVYAAPSRNTELWNSLNRDTHHRRAEFAERPSPLPVLAVWKALVRQPDRFVHLDTAAFVASPAPTSAEFKSRYGHLAGRVH